MAMPPIGGNGDGPGTENPWAINLHVSKFDREKFQVNRKLFSLGNKYYIYDEFGQPLFFIDRPVLALKAVFTVYEDDTRTRPLMTLTQESALTIMNFTFIVADTQGQVIGYLRRKGMESILRRKWHIEDGQERMVALALEDSWPRAILRRLIGEQGLISMLVRTNFILVRSEGAAPFGEYNRRLSLTDQHVMDLSNDPERSFDRRLAVALAIVLDNTEHQR